MKQISPRRLLVIGSLFGTAGGFALLALLEMWTLAAIVAAGHTSVLGLIVLLAIRDIRGLKKHSASNRKRHLRLERTIESMNTEQTRRYESLRYETTSQLASLRTDLRSLEETGSATLGRLESSERRMTGTLETFRIGHEDSTRNILASLRDGTRILDTLRGDYADLGKELRRHTTRAKNSAVTELTAVARDETRQVEALLQLLPTIAAKAPLPASGRWAMDARALLHLNHLCDEFKPERVLELGGGTSTVWLGYFLRESGASIMSVDHLEKFSQLTAESVLRHGLESNVKVHTAPLSPIDLGAETYEWYMSEVFDDLSDIDLLLVDGPPSSAGTLARYPALPVLVERLSQNCVVVLDDSDRTEEVSTLKLWLEEFTDFHRIDHNMSRLAVLRRSN